MGPAGFETLAGARSSTNVTQPRRCAVLGDPIAHSLSPVLHRAGYAALGLDWTYERHRVDEAGLGEFVTGLDATWRGLSLTMPLKRVALGLADEVSPTAHLAGAANTLVFDWQDTHARVLADNTDVPGAVAALRERSAHARQGISAATVLGGGATATSTGLALCDLGASRVHLLVRSPERADETRTAIARHPNRPEVSVGLLTEPEVVGEVVVSTIPATAQTPDLVAVCGAADVLFEVIYHPWPTPLASACREDQVLVSGLDLLAHQAALQLRLFTGREVDVEVLRRAGETALATDGDS